jgi:hypothetical protein
LVSYRHAQRYATQECRHSLIGLAALLFPAVRAIETVSKKADIPAATLQSWYYPRAKKSYVKNDVTNTDSQEAAEKSCTKIGPTDDGIYLCVTHRIAAAGNSSKIPIRDNKPHGQRSIIKCYLRSQRR